MQFNSYIFILLFLPVTLLAYHLLKKIRPVMGKFVLIAASIVFYAYTDITSFIILSASIAVNFLFAKLIERSKKQSKIFLIIPVVINVGLLLFFKYLNFGITNINSIFNMNIALSKLIAPLGISFITFQQIAYIVSVSKKEIEKARILDYLAFILYFPKILMGPLMEPKDFIDQLEESTKSKANWDNIACGIKIFCFGLFKKVMIADVFSKAVTWGFTNFENASSMDMILVMLFYTFEIYFDFSGYSDMAVGVSQMFNITLPINFNSPYKALSIRDFWKRWHISLTKFFTKYIYIPMGGSRKGKILTCVNTFVVFLISGLWHGANWTFILWGALHGLLMIFDRITEKKQEKIFTPARWIVTFSLTNVLWLLFRSESIGQFISALKRIFAFDSTAVSSELINCFKIRETVFFDSFLKFRFISDKITGFYMLIFIVAAFIICLFFENNYNKLKKVSLLSMICAAAAFLWSFINLSGESVFVYFNF